MPDVFLIPDGEPFKTDAGPGLSAPGGPLAIQGPPSCENDFPPAARTSAPCGPPAISKPPPYAPSAAHPSAAEGDLSEALYAYAREAAAGARYPAAYARAVLDRLRREGFRTLEEVRDSDRRFRSRSGPGEAGKERPVDPALDYLQRDDSGYRDVEYWIDLEKWAERNGCA